MRRFKVSSDRRSKNYKQLVVPFPFGLTRQIALRLEKKKIAVPARSGAWRRQAVLPAMLIVIGLSGTLFFGAQALSIDKSHKVEPAKTFSVKPAVPAKPQYLPRSKPVGLKIASVGIDTDVITVGKATDGTIQMPPLFDWVTGWYKYSPTPGQIGPAIIVGHVDNYKGISVFWRLRDVKPGDIVAIKRADGGTVKFKVDALKQFDQAHFPTKEVYGNINYAGLRLITCGGAFNTSTGQYTQNTVVYASLVKA